VVNKAFDCLEILDVGASEFDICPTKRWD
jgi:hypothetical protein